MMKETNITESASKILEVLVRRAAVAGHAVKVNDLMAASGLSDSEFDPADTYIVQAGYVEGTMGGRDGSRWLTPAGIQFHQSGLGSAKRHAEARGHERIAVFVFGVVFVFGLLALAIAFPKPTAFQYTVFRIVLALAASGVAAFLPGFVEVDVNRWLRAGGAIAVFVIIYFFSPANLITEDRSSLELRPPSSVASAPFASIEFKNARPFVDKVVLGDESFRGYMFKVQIENNSSDVTLQVKHLELTDLQQLQGNTFKAWENAETVYLAWDGTKYREIPPGGKVLVPFARIFPPELQREIDGHLSGGVDTPQLRFTVPLDRWPRKMTSHIPPGTHRFKIQVFFEKGPPAEIELQLEWTGKHRESPDAMVQEIKIKKLKMLGPSKAKSL